MTDTVTELLRCPLDPSRQSHLTRQQQELVCNCGTRFPVKNGLPILIADQAELPCEKQQLPCRKKKAHLSPASQPAL